MSLTVAAGDKVVGEPSAAYEADAATLLSVGALSTAVILTVVVCVALLSVPSLTTHETVRLASAPKCRILAARCIADAVEHLLVMSQCVATGQAQHAG